MSCMSRMRDAVLRLSCDRRTEGGSQILSGHGREPVLGAEGEVGLSGEAVASEGVFF